MEKYGRVLVSQTMVSFDWRADPKRMNNTWEPWMIPGPGMLNYGFYSNSAISFAVDSLSLLFRAVMMLLAIIMYYIA